MLDCKKLERHLWKKKKKKGVFLAVWFQIWVFSAWWIYSKCLITPNIFRISYNLWRGLTNCLSKSGKEQDGNNCLFIVSFCLKFTSDKSRKQILFQFRNFVLSYTILSQVRKSFNLLEVDNQLSCLVPINWCSVTSWNIDTIKLMLKMWVS